MCLSRNGVLDSKLLDSCSETLREWRTLWGFSTSQQICFNFHLLQRTIVRLYEMYFEASNSRRGRRGQIQERIWNAGLPLVTLEWMSIKIMKLAHIYGKLHNDRSFSTGLFMPLFDPITIC